METPASAFASTVPFPVAVASFGCCTRLLLAASVDGTLAEGSGLSDAAGGVLPDVVLAATGAGAAPESANAPSDVTDVVAVPVGVFCSVRDAGAVSLAVA